MINGSFNFIKSRVSEKILHIENTQNISLYGLNFIESEGESKLFSYLLIIINLKRCTFYAFECESIN